MTVPADLAALGADRQLPTRRLSREVETRVVSNLRHSESIFIARSPESLFDLVSDVERTGEWSPTCRACWWDAGHGPTPGAWFTGRNETAERVWETRSRVAVAERGREFTFIVGGTRVRWSYTFIPAGGGTTVTESWAFLPAGIELFRERFGEDAEAQVAERARAARTGIPATLAAIKQIAEASEPEVISQV